jgi:hypothetical protein
VILSALPAAVLELDMLDDDHMGRHDLEFACGLLAELVQGAGAARADLLRLGQFVLNGLDGQSFELLLPVALRPAALVGNRFDHRFGCWFYGVSRGLGLIEQRRRFVAAWRLLAGRRKLAVSGKPHLLPEPLVLRFQIRLLRLQFGDSQTCLGEGL